MPKRTSFLTAAAFGLALGPALAQDPPPPALINVNLENIRAEIAKNLNIDLQNVPITILLPVAVAANVCGVDVAAIQGANVGQDAGTCTATNTTLATQYVTNNTAAAPASGNDSTGAAAAASTTGTAPAEGGASGTPPTGGTSGVPAPADGAAATPDSGATDGTAPAQ